MRPRMIMVLAAATIVLGGLLLVPAAIARFSSDAAPAISGAGGAAGGSTPASPTPPPPPTLAPAPVSLKVDGFASWALLDRKTGKISGAANMTATSSTESMIKVWIVSNYLRGLGPKQEPSTTMLKYASLALRDSDDDATEAIYKASGGYSGGQTSPVVKGMIKTCGLTETHEVVPPGSKVVWWAYTQISARDAVRLGECVKSGKAAGPKWTKWVLDEMTKVRGSTAKKDQQERRGGGRWGIIDGLSEELLATRPVGIKNGWTLYGNGQWHVSCLAVADDWVLSVLTHYAGKLGLDYGAKVCASVASQLETPRPKTAVDVPPTPGPTEG